MTTPTQPEPWLRGPVDGFDPLLMPVVHTLIQAREDIEKLVARVPVEHTWERPGGAASIGFHVRHLGGALDRLFTYARGEAWSDAQQAAGYCQVDEKLVDLPQRYWVRARPEPTMLGIRNGRQPHLDNTSARIPPAMASSSTPNTSPSAPTCPPRGRTSSTSPTTPAGARMNSSASPGTRSTRPAA